MEINMDMSTFLSLSLSLSHDICSHLQSLLGQS
jgi:hypothetical protein